MTDQAGGLLTAAENGELEKIQNAPSIDTPTMQTIATAAAKAGQLPVLQHALANGATADSSELVAAALDSPNILSVITCLLDNGLDPNITIGYLGTPLIMAAQKENLQLLQLLISKGADPNIGLFGPRGTHTCLSLASGRGNLSVMTPLLDAGAKVKETWALQTAAKLGKEDAVKLLLRRGADPNEVLTGPQAKMHPMTALGEAAKAGKMGTVKILVESGGKPSVKDADGKTVLEIAEGSGQKEIYEYLWKLN